MSRATARSVRHPPARPERGGTGPVRSTADEAGDIEALPAPEASRLREAWAETAGNRSEAARHPGRSQPGPIKIVVRFGGRYTGTTGSRPAPRGSWLRTCADQYIGVPPVTGTSAPDM
ncbi:hypothetical protein SAMN04488125_102241 [Methylorubrum salsuginis]|uniref:Uncharacterized protein n=1 Tax=Methylorubrum salsuginis TaxID=414703 RepID=A0A1I4A6B3_9HYPH|nr:hypothetical protein SAMN04488125_102241 [Methylorubrum salsuginis]